MSDYYRDNFHLPNRTQLDDVAALRTIGESCMLLAGCFRDLDLGRSDLPLAEMIQALRQDIDQVAGQINHDAAREAVAEFVERLNPDDIASGKLCSEDIHGYFNDTVAVAGRLVMEGKHGAF